MKFRVLVALTIFIWVGLFFTMVHADFGLGAIAPQPLPAIGQPRAPAKPTACSNFKGYPREACSRVMEWLVAFDRSDWKKHCGIFSAAYYRFHGDNYAKCVSFFSRQPASFQTDRVSYRIMDVYATSDKAIARVIIAPDGFILSMTRADDGKYHIDRVSRFV